MRSLAFCALFVAIAMVMPAHTAPGPKPSAKPDRAGGSEVVRKALDSVGKFEFSETPLPGLLKTLSEDYKVEIVLDQGAVMQMGMAPEMLNVKLSMKEGKLRQALKAIAGQYNLTYAPIGDTILVTTEEMATYRQLKQKVNVDYDATPIGRALKELSAQTGVQIMMDPRVVKAKAADAPVTLQQEDMPLEAAVRLLCELADLKPVRFGNLLFVTTEARADKLKDGDHLVPPPNGLVPGVHPLALPDGVGGGGIGVAPGVPVAPLAPVKD